MNQLATNPASRSLEALDLRPGLFLYPPVPAMIDFPHKFYRVQVSHMKTFVRVLANRDRVRGFS